MHTCDQGIYRCHGLAIWRLCDNRGIVTGAVCHPAASSPVSQLRDDLTDQSEFIHVEML
jgi:hypothetical protein